MPLQASDRHYTPGSRPETRTLRIRLTQAERAVWRRRRYMPPSRWVEQHRVLTMSAIPGRWHNSVTPYLAGVMDASYYPSVRTVVLCAAPQVGKSEAVNNMIAYAIDRDPGPVLYVYPDEITARDNSRDRILPMIQASQVLSRHLSDLGDDASALRIGLRHMPLYMAWARSASRLANKPIRYLVLDETDKYPDTAGKREADPISLALKRTTTYRDECKVWYASTPTVESGPIWQAMNAAQEVFHYHVRCPACHGEQMMVFDRIVWPGPDEGGRDPERVMAERMARYACAHCEAKWTDEQRDQAVRAGKWRAVADGLHLRTVLKRRNPQSIGFHIPSWLSTFVSLSQVAGAFLRGLKDKNALKDFLNAHKAEPWIPYEVKRSEDRILALRDERPRGLVPSEAVGLVASVDTQDNGFWFEVRAFGPGHVPTSWCVREGFIPGDWSQVPLEALENRPWPYHPTFDALRQTLWDDVYTDANGRAHPIRLTVVDSAGHRTTEVYDFCRAHRGQIIPLRGERTMSTAHKFSVIDTYPGSNKPIPGGVRLLRVNTSIYKGKLSSLLDIAPADPGAFLFHGDFDPDHARHYTAEYEDEKGVWQCISGRANHLWDCSAYNLAAAELARLRYQGQDSAQARQTPRPKHQPSTNPYTTGSNPFAR